MALKDFELDINLKISVDGMTEMNLGIEWARRLGYLTTAEELERLRLAIQGNVLETRRVAAREIGPLPVLEALREIGVFTGWPAYSPRTWLFWLRTQIDMTFGVEA